MTETKDKDELTLKWGTLKAWHMKSEAGQAALQAYFDAGDVSAGAMTQDDTPAQKDAICALIDAANLETVYLDWDGKDVSKDEAKAYVRDYGRPAKSEAAA